MQNSDSCIRLNLACPRTELSKGLKRISEAINSKLDGPEESETHQTATELSG